MGRNVPNGVNGMDGRTKAKIELEILARDFAALGMMLRITQRFLWRKYKKFQKKIW